MRAFTFGFTDKGKYTCLPGITVLNDSDGLGYYIRVGEYDDSPRIYFSSQFRPDVVDDPLEPGNKLILNANPRLLKQRGDQTWLISKEEEIDRKILLLAFGDEILRVDEPYEVIDQDKDNEIPYASLLVLKPAKKIYIAYGKNYFTVINDVGTREIKIIPRPLENFT
jgi:hypothetical protein